MLFPMRRNALATLARKDRRSRLSVELLEDRLVLNGAVPSVLFKVDVSGSEQVGTSFTHIQDVAYPHDLTAAPNFNDPPLVAMVPPATGKITASVSIAVKGQDGMLSVTQKGDYRYDNFGGPPFVLHNLGLGESVSIYVLGAPGTPYTFASKGSSVHHEHLGYVDYQNPGIGWSSSDYVTPEFKDISSNKTIIYNGNIYSKTNQLESSGVGGGYYISRILGGYPAFTDTADVTAKIDIKVVDLAVSNVDIDVLTAKMTALDALTYLYRIEGDLPSGSSVGVGIYRSSQFTFDRATAIFIGHTFLPDTSSGTHSGVWPGTLGIDVAHPYVLVVADPNESVADNDGDSSNDDNTAYFRKYVVAAVTHGWEPSGSENNTAWVREMAAALESKGYDTAIPFLWADLSHAWLPGVTVAEGNLLAFQVLEAAKKLANGDSYVVDVQLIGHSRGAVVVSQAFRVLENLPGAKTVFGFRQMTLLDSHPANPRTADTLFSYRPIVGKPFAIMHGRFSRAVLDPEVMIPPSVNKTDSYYQRTLYNNVDKADRFGGIFNMWGEPIGEDHNLTNAQPGISHSTVHDWYLRNVILKLPARTG